MTVQDARTAQNTLRQLDAQQTAAGLNLDYAGRMAAVIRGDLQKYIDPAVPMLARVSREPYDYDINDSHPNCIEVRSTNGDTLRILAEDPQLVERNVRVVQWSAYTTVLTFRR